jgi:hypothetical protein
LVIQFMAGPGCVWGRNTRARGECNAQRRASQRRASAQTSAISPMSAISSAPAPCRRCRPRGTAPDKSKLPSRHVTEGPARAPHRSYFYAMGISEEEIHQPWVGVATCWNEAAPCNIALNRQAQAVKHGVKKGGGTPREFTTITVTDGIAMGHEGMRSSLASREAIADTVELTMRGHCYDALVGLRAATSRCRA